MEYVIKKLILRVPCSIDLYHDALPLLYNLARSNAETLMHNIKRQCLDIELEGEISQVAVDFFCFNSETNHTDQCSEPNATMATIWYIQSFRLPADYVLLEGWSYIG